MNGVEFVDLSFTDGQSAAWGGSLTSAMLGGIVGSLSEARPAAIEALSPAVIDECLARGEHPLRRLEVLRRQAGTTPLRAVVNLIPGHSRFDVLEGELLGAWLNLLARRGIAEVVVIDPWDDPVRFKRAVAMGRDCGLAVTASLAYEVGGSLSDAQYRERTSELVASGATRLMLRDEAGLLHTDRLASLLPAVRAGAGSVPVDLHTRCHTGLGPQVALEAMHLGISRLDTVLPSLANGASLPSLPHMLRSARLLGLPVQALDGAAADRANRKLSSVAEQEGIVKSVPWAFDIAPYVHKLPGEVAAEAMVCLRQLGRWADLHAFARECERVREDFGAPPMLQPFARPIMLIAMSHLEGGSRYPHLYPPLRRVLQGVYGTVPSAKEELVRRVGRVPAPRTAPHPPTDDDALLAMVAGISPEDVPSPGLTDYRCLPPEQALVNGLMRRWPSYKSLVVTGPDFSVRLEHTNGS